MANRRPLVVALALAALLVAVPGDATAQLPTTTTVPPPVPVPPDPPFSSTTVVTAPPVTEPVPTDTTPPAPPPEPPPPADPPVGDGGDPANPQDPAAPGATPPPLSDETVALILDNRVRTGDSSTAALLDALRPLTGLGFSEQEAFMLGMGRFPVAGLATWSDDFHDPRYNPTPHLHQGNDIWAAMGALVRSPADGVVQLTGEAVGGISVYVTTSDGTYYYMTHLAGFAPDLANGDRVRTGQLVGFNGATGNAAGGPPHVHFEIHPGGGGAVNPKPILDQWVAEALAAATTQATDQRETNPRVLLSTGELRRFDVAPSATAERAAKSPLLWSASVTSGGAALRLAEVEAARMAQRVDWTGRAVQAQITAVDRHRAQRRAANLLSRVTPPVLRAVLDGGAS